MLRLRIKIYDHQRRFCNGATRQVHLTHLVFFLNIQNHGYNNQLEKLEAARSAYLCLPSLTFPYLSLPFLTFPNLSLPFHTFPYLSLSLPSFWVLVLGT